MKILFIRHSAAEDRFAFQGHDLDRKLTDAGRKKAEKAFSTVANLYPEIELIISSEAVRARETAEILYRAVPNAKLKTMNLLNPGADFTSFRHLMKKIGFKHEAIALVGHEPDFSSIIAGITADGHLRINVKKASCIVVDVNTLCKGELLVSIPAKVLAAVKDL